MRKLLLQAFRRSRIERDLDEEHFCVDALTDEKIRSGMAPEGKTVREDSIRRRRAGERTRQGCSTLEHGSNRSVARSSIRGVSIS